MIIQFTIITNNHITDDQTHLFLDINNHNKKNMYNEPRLFITAKEKNFQDIDTSKYCDIDNFLLF